MAQGNYGQCPNCGGYKGKVEKQVTIATEKQQIKNGGATKFINLVFWGPVVLFLVYMAIGSIQYGILLSLVIGAIALALAVFLLNLLTDRFTKTVPSVIKFNLYCNLCGYRWIWQSDQSYPQVNVNPALILQGEQRLQEEARRNQEQMQAAWWLQQQQKK